MAVTNGWGQGVDNNTIEWGKGKDNATNNWGKVYETSASGDTLLEVATVPFSNTKSVDFDGVDDFVTMGNQSSLDFEQTDAFSISAWVKRNSTSNYHTIASKQLFSNGSVQTGYKLLLNNDDTVRFLLVYIVATHRFIDIKTTNTITDNNWHHIVLTYDGTGGSNAKNGVEIYINGSQETVSRSGTLLASGVTTLNSAPFNIGARDNQSDFMDGKIDEVAVFNSELSASDVTAIYNSGTPLSLSSYNPISWWRMGDNDTFPTLTDNGSGGNNGTMTNMVAGDIVADVPPNFNLYSLDFDGVDDFVDCGDNDNLSFGDGSTDSPFSISAWVNMHSSSGFRIVNKYGSDKEYYFSFNSGATASKLFFNLYDNSLGTAYIGQKSVSTYASLENQWIHIVGTYNGNGASSGIKLYINGAVILSHTNNFGSYVAMENTSESVTIGKVTTNYTDGLIDEVGIFNTELSASEVASIYNSGVPNDLSSYSSLVSWWRFEEGSGTTATDSGSGGNNGTITNGATYSTDKP